MGPCSGGRAGVLSEQRPISEVLPTLFFPPPDFENSPFLCPPGLQRH